MHFGLRGQEVQVQIKKSKIEFQSEDAGEFAELSLRAKIVRVGSQDTSLIQLAGCGNPSFTRKGSPKPQSSFPAGPHGKGEKH